MKIIFKALLLFFLPIQLIYTQNNEISFKRIGTKSGLSSGWVRSVYQDQKGFLWAGTDDGLNRYDGYEFKTYRPENEKRQHLGHIQVSSISQKNDKELWLATSGGLYTYNYTDDRLIHNPTLKTVFVSDVLTDSENNIWFAHENGLSKKNVKNGALENFTHDQENPNSISNNYAIFIFEDSDHTIWIGTQNGLNRYDPDTNSFTRYQIDAKNPKIGKYVLSIAEDQKKRLWIGTSQDGYYLMKDKNKNDFELINGGFITKLIVDRDNILWVTKGSGGGLDRVDIEELDNNPLLQIENLRYDSYNTHSLSENSLFEIYEDNTGDLWVGSYGSGVNYYSKKEKQIDIIQKKTNSINSIQNNLVTAIFEEEKYIWYGTDAGIDQYNKITKTYEHFQYRRNDPRSLGANPIACLYKDSHNNLWAGTWGGGLNRYDYKKRNFESFIPSNKKETISSPHVFAVLEDDSNNLWIGTIGGGLNKYNYDTKKFISYQNDAKDPTSIKSNYIKQIYQLSNGDIYLISNYDLQKFDPEKEEFYPYDFNNNSDIDASRIISIYEDQNKNIWVGTNVGLYTFDEKTKIFTPYQASEKLINISIQAILEDNDGNIWLSSNKGIFKITDGISLPENPNIHHYTSTDGLPGNEFKKRSAFKNKDGKLYFGSSSGATSFYPKNLNINSIPPKIVLTEFQLLHDDAKESKKYIPTVKNVDQLKVLELPYTASDFIIKFTALNYLHPEKNQYKYKLQGLDKQWIDSQGKRSVTYTNIQPGTYEFMVKASNNDGIWNATPKAFQITINPPWWGTLLFKTIMGFLLISSILLVYKIRISFLKKQNFFLEKSVENRTNELTKKNELLHKNSIKIATQNEELENHRHHLEQLVSERTKELVLAKIKAEESDKLKSSFMANMSHEIRTPMNAIYGFSSLLDDETLSKEERQKYIAIVKDGCDSLLLLIDNILDISMIKSNHLVIDTVKFDINDVLSELETTFRKNNPQNIQIKFANANKKEGFYIYNDRMRFRQIMYNLLSNALKFTESGSITFGYEQLEEQIQYYVTDTGIGVDPTKKDTIFEPFYKITSSDNKLYGGTGVGLAICKSLISQLDGEIWVVSSLGAGATFYFTIPIENKIKSPIITAE